MGQTWVLSAPCGPHAVPINLAIRDYKGYGWQPSVHNHNKNKEANAVYMFRGTFRKLVSGTHNPVMCQNDTHCVTRHSTCQWTIDSNDSSSSVFLQEISYCRAGRALFGVDTNTGDVFKFDIWTNIFKRSTFRVYAIVYISLGTNLFIFW